MNIIDLIVVIIFAYALINGFIKGFILEIAGMIALVLGLIGAFKFSSMLGNYLAVYVAWSPKTIQTVSFILLFIVIIYAVSLLAKIITKTLKIIALGWLNRISGALFGFLKWGVLLSALVLISQEINEIITLMPEATINKSKSYPILMELGNFLFDWVMQTQTVQEQQFI